MAVGVGNSQRVRGRGLGFARGRRRLYRFVRHPIYAGLLAYGVGSVLVNPHPATLVAAAGLLVLLMAKARWEESMLLTAAPGYRQYAQRVGRFVPGVGRLPD